MTQPLGLVLAGGRSRRFGAEKAMAQVDGRPMIGFAVALLRNTCSAVAVSAPQASAAAAWAGCEGLAVLHDDPAHPQGPLAGIAAGLRWAETLGAPRLVTAPCDTPRLPADLVERLLGADAPVVMAETADGLQPLCAVWSVALLEPLTLSLAAGDHGRVQDFIRAHGGVALRFEDASAFANVNAPRDLRES